MHPISLLTPAGRFPIHHCFDFVMLHVIQLHGETDTLFETIVAILCLTPPGPRLDFLFSGFSVTPTTGGGQKEMQ